MATVVDQAKELAEHLRRAARESRRIVIPAPGANGVKRPPIDPVDFRRRGV